ncbi:MAG TPA: hypothetical protein VLY03_08730 [Bacteroidota bacterium]|nr:hypothetical protein [Bacteroidota bacterium]
MDQRSRAGVHRTPPSRKPVEELQQLRANLHHLIYFMEHDRSLGADETRIGLLRRLLNGIEQQMSNRNHLRFGHHL